MSEQEILIKMTEAIKSAKSSIKASEKWVEQLASRLGVSNGKMENPAPHMEIQIEEDGKIIEGVFEGQNMVDTEKNEYPVPANYASKSKLIPGDRLKLTIAENGAFIYKQIELIPRKLIVGYLVLDGSQYQVLAEGKTYNVLYASVTFFRGKVGDKVTIIVPSEYESKWAAVENVIPEAINKEAETLLASS